MWQSIKSYLTAHTESKIILMPGLIPDLSHSSATKKGKQSSDNGFTPSKLTTSPSS